ncbi:MAG TPA: 3-phosphoshikimate 1-carboxyvinyltransferase [Peptococcaceae bacterium]|nr:MAG: 3-phosphoshikimate 1-carboxyvinyltransferase [Clostridia bacterium 41_269]HBT20514.1 3-phosphoshikimate 1-carboxyvinyltransferase [Peptococcaceae bacterium]
MGVQPLEIKICRANSLKGEVEVPGDKSISHRAVMLGALAEGITEIKGFLSGEDCLSTVKCFRQLGVKIEELGKNHLKVYGVGLNGFTEPEDVLDAGNSGTTMRLLLGILSGQKFYSVITGDASLRKRPMDRVIKPLKMMGAQIRARNKDSLAPVSILGHDAAVLKPIEYETPVASAQVKSALLLAGLFCEGTTVISEKVKTRDHTERMLKAFGADIEIKDEGRRILLKGPSHLRGREVKVPGDISSASFFIVAGCLVPGSEIIISNVGVNSTRTGILDILSSMGADIKLFNKRILCGEPVADIAVKHSSLKAVEIGGEIIPRVIDEIPVLAVAACRAYGTTVIRDAAELRYKETDRIGIIAAELRKMGARIKEMDDGFIIEGPVSLKGASLNSHGDHRIAMALAVAGLTAEGETIIKDAQCAAISFPNFYETLWELMEISGGK